MPLALAQDAIALLIDMAERGEVDPWDVQVIDVIDRFLNQLDPTNGTGRELYETNLSQSGQAFLYASMLLLLKADNLAQAEVVIEPAIEDEVLELELGSPLPPHLERRLQRRAVAQPPRRRRVTLTELIEQFQAIAAALEDPTPRVRPRPRSQSRRQAMRAIAELAHQENLSEMALLLEQFFSEHWDNVTRNQDWLDFELLLEFWSQIKPADDAEHGPNHDRVGIFWALLLLSAQSKVELEQEEFYQDLKIHVSQPIAIAAIAPPVSL